MLFETLEFIDSIITHLNSGLSVFKSIELAAQENKSQISKFSKYFLKTISSGETALQATLVLKNTENKILFLILEMGMKGFPVLQTLEDFYKEVKFSNSIQIDNYQKSLPFKMMIPLLFFYFPAITLLFLGPFLMDFMNFSKTM
jgi:pilus assembly protein TadC